MFNNYLKIALRNILRHKSYSFINIIGLSVGLACAILILLWVQDEMSYDRYQKNANRICQVYSTYFIESGEHSDGNTSGGHAQDLKVRFPGILEFTRFGDPGELLLKYILSNGQSNVKTFVESGGMAADPMVFNLFTYAFVRGNPRIALKDPHSIVLTERVVKKIFGKNDPMHKIIRINNKFDFVVTGVIKNIPLNSQNRFDFLVPFVFLKELGQRIDGYGNQDFTTYVLLQDKVSYQELSNKIYNNFMGSTSRIKIKNYLVPLLKTRFHQYDGMRLGLIFVFSLLAVCILIIACINFMNLSTARAIYRSKEVGIRKVVGARRIQLIKQFLGESIFLTIIAYFFGLFLVELLLPYVNHISVKQMSIQYFDLNFIIKSLIIILFTGVISGCYPAFYISSFQPVKVLKESSASGKGRGRFRKILVVTQFCFAIVFIIVIAILYLQMDHMQKGDIGFEQKNIIYIPVKGEIWDKYESVKNELLLKPHVLNITSSSHLPQYINSSIGDWGKKEGDKNAVSWHTSVGYDYIKAFEMEMVRGGRFFSKQHLSDKTDSIVVNESIVKSLGMDSPVGERFWYLGKYYIIIGVVKDFDCFPLAVNTKNLIMDFKPVNKYMFVKIRPVPMSSVIDDMKQIFKKYNPDYPFEYHFLDEYINDEVKPIKPVLQIILSLAILAIIISCLGLFGLSSFMVERRTKEIGIRKVLGAPINGIIKLLSKEFIKLLFIANAIAWPITYLLMSKVLRFLTNRIDLKIWVFFATGAFVFILAIMTVGYQAFKAATANPVDSLKCE